MHSPPPGIGINASLDPADADDHRYREMMAAGLDLLDEGVTVFDHDLRLVACNSTFLRLLDFPASMAEPGTPFEAFMRYNAERNEYGPGDPDQQVAERMAAAWTFKAHQTRRRRPDGRLLQIRGYPLPHRGFITLYADITEQDRQARQIESHQAELEEHIRVRTADLTAAMEENRRTTEALQRSEARLQQITDAIPAHIAYFDRDWVYRYANRSYAEWFGLTSQTMAGVKIQDAIGELYESVKDHVVLALGGQEVTYEYAMLNRQGRMVSARSTLVPDLGPDGQVRGCFVHAVDITEQRRTQSALAQAQKMEAIGQLTGGLAHDFNNMLTVVMGNLNGLREQFPDNEAAAPLIESAAEAAAGGADLVRRLLAFARQQPIAPCPVEVNELVLRLTRMVRRSLPKTIALVTALAHTEMVARVDPNQLESALLNLALNARDAMPRGGELRIETDLETLDSRSAADLELTPGNYIRIAVSDNGTGMDSATMAHIFEPFFTTKAFGKGSGLGLSMVYGFIKQSGGGVRIRSRQAVGTTVALLLPCLREGSPDEDGTVSDTLLGNRLVLLVEDVEEVRKVVRRQLSSLGLNVIEAESGNEAADMVEHIGEIALVLSDVVMPGGMDGRALSRFIRRFRPDVPVVLMSGFADKVATYRDDDTVLILEKPFTDEALEKTLRTAIAKTERMKHEQTR